MERITRLAYAPSVAKRRTRPLSEYKAKRDFAVTPETPADVLPESDFAKSPHDGPPVKKPSKEVGLTTGFSGSLGRGFDASRQSGGVFSTEFITKKWGTFLKSLSDQVHLAGLEPATFGSVDRRSIQLS